MENKTTLEEYYPNFQELQNLLNLDLKLPNSMDEAAISELL